MNAPSTQLYIPDDGECRTCNRCASHCPTFKVTRLSEESPRGRLKLIAKVIEQNQQLSDTELQHLNNCVECRACEKICPSKMRYGKLLRKARTKLPAMLPAVSVRMLLFATRSKQRLTKLFSLLMLYQRSGLQYLFEQLGLLKLMRLQRLGYMLPRLTPYQPFADFYPATATRRGSVALFTGCLSSTLDQPTLHASIKVLNRFGYDVHVPAQQQCCGAIHAHNQAKPVADEFANTNLAVFDELEVEAILFTASGCGAILKHYRHRKLSNANQERLARFEARLQEINQFIAGQEWPADLQLQPLAKRVVVHEPCTQQFPLRTNKAAYDFLQRIPGLELTPLAENNLCCGAGGSYMLSHPQMSDAIRAEKLQQLADSHAQILLTSNVGCATHLAAGIFQQDLPVVVAHPIELLAQQLA